MRDHARELRARLTLSERRVWNWLRNRYLGYKFRRQFPVAGYILDFYCAELRLAIEVDGRQHDQIWVAECDSVRTADLITMGIQVLRIPNVLIAKDPLTAEQQIQFAIQRRAEEHGPSSGLRPPSPR